MNGFTVVHYAGDVAYDTSGFLEKNRDYIIPEQLSLLEHAAKLQTSLFQKVYRAEEEERLRSQLV